MPSNFISVTKPLLLILVVSMLTGCSRGPAETIAQPAKQESSVSIVPLSEINLAAIGSIAPKGRVQDRDYNDLPIITSLIAHRNESIPYLISKLEDETKIEGHTIDYWYEVRVGDVALIILTNFFKDSSQNATIPGVSWDEFLARGAKRDLTGEQVLRNFISKHGRREIRNRWQEIWREYQQRLFWDETERCFRLTTWERYSRWPIVIPSN